MYRKLILPLALALSTPAIVSEQTVDAEFCFYLGDYGATVMTNRQNNLDYSFLRAQILEQSYIKKYNRELVDLLLLILNQAYQVPVQNNPKLKRKVIAEFSSYVRDSCFQAI